MGGFQRNRVWGTPAQAPGSRRDVVAGVARVVRPLSPPMHALLPHAHPATSWAPPRAASVPSHLPPPPPLVGEVAEATTLLDEMFLMGCSADVNTFNDIVHGLCMLGRLREAARLVDRMMIRGCLPNIMTYGFLIQGLCRARQVDEARTMLGRVPELNVVLFNTVIAGCLLDGKLTEATELYEIMGSKGCPPDFTLTKIS
ncbi:hypothetical protein ZWY2020_004157 [Hordeum vulgare]|nr:hypothetical protein ZWY2020_004157 [Hordeum vulgare]